MVIFIRNGITSILCSSEMLVCKNRMSVRVTVRNIDLLRSEYRMMILHRVKSKKN